MARPPKDPSPASDSGKVLPAPEEIVAREARQRKVAVYTAVALAIVTAAAVIIENVMASSVPDGKTSTLIDTFGAAARGESLPASYYSAVGDWKLDHVLGTSTSLVLRALVFLLMIPPALFLFRGARDRGGSLLRAVDPLFIIGALVMLIGPLAVAVGEPTFYHSAREAGFGPGAIRDAAGDSFLIYVQIPVFAGSLLVGMPLAFGAMQAYRTGLLPPMLGFMGVLVGILFVIPLESSGLLRAFWFSAVAFFISGRATSGLAEAWTTGVAVAPVPRQPPEPREKKKPKLTKK